MRDAEKPGAGADLLRWYDRAARVMPWRVGPAERRAGQRPDPYHVWLSEVMLQQTTVAAVRAYFRRFVALWPGVADLAGASDAAVMQEWAGLGYYARARNLLACAREVAGQRQGRFPGDEVGLLSLPGIGPYTAAAIAAIAFDQPAVVVDGNVERVVSRLWAVDRPLPQSRPLLRELAARLTPQDRPGDHAQAMMDLGATVCTPRNPKCDRCPLSAYCDGRAAGRAAELPHKAQKPEKPVRRGRLWLAMDPRDGALLLETRPARGLLGGMPGFPGDAWDGAGAPTPPIEADWQRIGEVRHTFTHFHLVIEVLAASVTAPPAGATHTDTATTDSATPATATTASATSPTAAAEAPCRGDWRRIDPRALPTLMRKAHDLALARLQASADFSPGA